MPKGPEGSGRERCDCRATWRCLGSEDSDVSQSLRAAPATKGRLRAGERRRRGCEKAWQLDSSWTAHPPENPAQTLPTTPSALTRAHLTYLSLTRTYLHLPALTLPLPALTRLTRPLPALTRAYPPSPLNNKRRPRSP